MATVTCVECYGIRDMPYIYGLTAFNAFNILKSHKWNRMVNINCDFIASFDLSDGSYVEIKKRHDGSVFMRRINENGTIAGKIECDNKLKEN